MHVDSENAARAKMMKGKSFRGAAAEKAAAEKAEKAEKAAEKAEKAEKAAEAAAEAAAAAVSTDCLPAAEGGGGAAAPAVSEKRERRGSSSTDGRGKGAKLAAKVGKELEYASREALLKVRLSPWTG